MSSRGDRKSVSRRAFLGAAVAGAGGVGMAVAAAKGGGGPAGKVGGAPLPAARLSSPKSGGSAGQSGVASAPAGLTILEPAREVPIAAECDLCVIGGGCTGVFAAVAAARLGARVCLVENLGLLGGTAAASLVNIWHSIYDTAGTRQIIAGLTTEVMDRLKKRGAVQVSPATNRSRYYVFNSAELSIELDELVAEAKVRPFLHTRFARPVAEEGGPVTVAVVEDKTGRRAIRARCFIDATGDGDLIRRIPLATRRDEVLQPPTTCAILTGLDEVAKANKGFSLGAAVHDPKYPNALRDGFLWDSSVPGVPGARMVAGTRVHGADCSDADELTRAEIEGRRQVRAMCDIVRGNFQEGAKLGLVALPARIGIRQSRQACCLHTLTEQEVLMGKRFDDAVANGSYRVDVHHSDKPGLTFRYLDGTEEYVVPGRPTVKGRWREPVESDPTFYQVPYRSLVPRGSRNVWVAGRLVDADRGAFGAVRVMVNCNQLGQAVGAAAALALQAGLAPADVDPAKLREVLKQQGAAIA